MAKKPEKPGAAPVVRDERPDRERYPAMRYSNHTPPVIVQNADEEQALGAGWYDSPAKVPDKAED